MNESKGTMQTESVRYPPLVAEPKREPVCGFKVKQAKAAALIDSLVSQLDTAAALVKELRRVNGEQAERIVEQRERITALESQTLNGGMEIAILREALEQADRDASDVILGFLGDEGSTSVLTFDEDLLGDEGGTVEVVEDPDATVDSAGEV